MKKFDYAIDESGKVWRSEFVDGDWNSFKEYTTIDYLKEYGCDNGLAVPIIFNDETIVPLIDEIKKDGGLK